MKERKSNRGERKKREGEKDGKWTYYNEDGSIWKVEEYKDGEIQTIFD